MVTDSTSGILVLRPDVVVTTLEREAVLLDLETKYFYSVNRPGWAIAQLFETGATLDAAREQSALWGASNGDLAAVNAFIERLVSERLLVPGTADDSGSEVTFGGEWATPSIEKHKEPLQRVMVSAFDPTLPLAE